MGAADVVPGVSGGTMAFILGIYARLLHAIRAFDLSLLALLARGRFLDAARHVDLAFLVALGLGIGSALAFFTRVVPLPALIVTSPEPVYAVFFGLVLGSVVVLLRTGAHPGATQWGWLALGAALGLAVVTLVPADTPDAPWFLFLSGALAITAMILPGISGSFVLLLLRKYATVFDAIGHLQLSVLVPFALGAVVGLMLFSRALSWLLDRFHRQTVLTIIGVLVASLWVIWPFQDRAYETVRGKVRLVHSSPVAPSGSASEIALVVTLAIAGFALVLVVEWLARRRGGDA
ncbi:MAG: DUF368 domain-containing protein [Ectothiorhodospiraceae bacterium]|nr:DUF368 domain-containing protein [Chromatiales bacterium]MCP5156480.1 DUF368 domain-containing protein [Ectothiorhodospiraceae bacterium]